MGWKIPRFRVGTMLLAIAVVAIGLGGFVWTEKMRHRRAIHQKWAMQCGRLASSIHRLGEAHARIVLRGGTAWPTTRDPAVGTFIPADRASEAEAYLLGMKSRFHRAANLPWLNVRFSPPPPGLERAFAAIFAPGSMGSPEFSPGAFVIVGTREANPGAGDSFDGARWLPLTESRRSRVAAPR